MEQEATSRRKIMAERTAAGKYIAQEVKLCNQRH
jgi:hypothetical protein